VNAVTAVAALEDRDRAGRGLRIEFLRLPDRFAHRVLAIGYDDLPVLLLESVEGAVEEAWPPSPAFRALNLEELRACRQSDGSPRPAMLVGMSGSTHWSMTVQRLSVSDTGEQFRSGPGLLFDAAARLKSPPIALTTRYAVGKRVRPQRLGDGMLLHFGCGRCRFDARSGDGIIDPNGWQFETGRNKLGLELAPDVRQRQLPATFRWVYTLRLIAD
jgi:hypothetical protein